MPITDYYFVRGKVSLEEICKLYNKLGYYEEHSNGFIHAKDKGIADAYNAAKEELSELISKSKEYGLDEFYPFFKERIDNLEKHYKLKD